MVSRGRGEDLKNIHIWNTSSHKKLERVLATKEGSLGMGVGEQLSIRVGKFSLAYRIMDTIEKISYVYILSPIPYLVT